MISLAPAFNRLLRGKPMLKGRALRIGRWLGLVVIPLCLLLTYGLVAGRLVLNGSDSLAARGFYVIAWPKPLMRGAIVAFEPPAAYAAQFEGLIFAKRLIGLPGDRIIHEDGRPCLHGICYPLHPGAGEVGATPLPAGRIPDGFVAAFGETPTSLDSRYASVGLIPESDILGVGVAIPYFPDWTEIAAWLDQ